MHEGVLRNALSDRPQWHGRRLVLHAGTPKTGTTSLQYFLDENRSGLSLSHIAYPTCRNNPSDKPKHQWIVTTMLEGLEQDFSNRLAASLDLLEPETQTIVLSTEGVYNHWSLFENCTKKWLSVLSEFFDFSCILWFREPREFCRSAYVQCLLNPQTTLVEHYGRDLSVADMLAIPSFASLFEYEATLAEMRAVMGEQNVFGFAYSADLIRFWCTLFGVIAPNVPRVRMNSRAMTAESVAMLRKLNRQELANEARWLECEKLLEHDASLQKDHSRYVLNEDEIRQLEKICPATAETLAEMGNASVARWRARFGK